MIYEMESKSQKSGKNRVEGGIFGEKKGRTFPSSRRRSYNKAIVFRTNGARSNKGAMQVREYSSKQYFAVSDQRRRRRFASLKVSTIPRQRLSAVTMSCRKNPSFMDFRCRQTGAPGESNPDTSLASGWVLFEGRTVAFYHKDTRHAETLTDLRMREATAAIAPATFTSSVLRAGYRRYCYRQPASIF